MVSSRQMLNSSAHSVSKTFSTDKTAGCLFLQSVVKTVKSSSYIQNLYLCYLQIITFPSSWNSLKNSSIQEAKDQTFLHPDSPLHFLRMTAPNKKVDGPQVQTIRRMNHEWNATNLFHWCWLHCKRCHNLCDNCPGFHLTASESLEEKSFNYSCSAVHQSKTVAVRCCRPAKLAPCAAVFPLHGYLPSGNRLSCFSMSNVPLPVYILLFSHGSQYLTTLQVCYKACIPHCHLALWFVGIYSLCCHSEYFTSNKMTLMVTAINLTTHVSHRTDLCFTNWTRKTGEERKKARYNFTMLPTSPSKCLAVSPQHTYETKVNKHYTQ